MDKAAHKKLCANYQAVASSLTKAAYARQIEVASATRLAKKIAGLADREIPLLSEGGVNNGPIL